jgi:hypothetical protein
LLVSVFGDLETLGETVHLSDRDAHLSELEEELVVDEEDEVIRARFLASHVLLNITWLRFAILVDSVGH